jgi:hypothetical protein
MTLGIAAAAPWLYGLACAYLYVVQDDIVFPGSKQMTCTPESAQGWPYEDIQLAVEGETTHAWYVPIENARGTVLFSHGSGGNISTRLDTVELFRELRMNVFLYDYGGYGSSTGGPSERRCYGDVRAAWRYLTETRGIPPVQIVLFGRSMGGGPTSQLASEVTPAGVILESTFVSMPAVAQTVIPVLPMRLIVRHQFANAAKVPRFTSPLLVIHSTDDELVPYEHGQALYHLASEPRQFIQIHGSHTSGFLESRSVWLAGMGLFLDTVFPARAVL